MEILAIVGAFAIVALVALIVGGCLALAQAAKLGDEMEERAILQSIADHEREEDP